MATGACPDAIFGVRAVAAQIGWLETSLPAAAVDALCNVEMLLCSGFSERSEQIYHQLLVFEACENGLLATWETPAELVCTTRPAGVVRFVQRAVESEPSPSNADRRRRARSESQHDQATDRRSNPDVPPSLPALRALELE